jgi:hypothetical protein
MKVHSLKNTNLQLKSGDYSKNILCAKGLRDKERKKVLEQAVETQDNFGNI